MDIRSRIGSSSLVTLTSASPPSHTTLFSCSSYYYCNNNTSFSYSYSYSPKKTYLLRPFCSNKNSQQQNGDNDSGDKSATDWDKAWSKFKKQGKKTKISQFNPNKYVSWNPRRSEYPLSEEVDPIKRAERSNLMLWTSPRFTLGIAIVIVTFLLIYTLLAPIM